jgi:hypothetical protein
LFPIKRYEVTNKIQNTSKKYSGIRFEIRGSDSLGHNSFRNVSPQI